MAIFKILKNWQFLKYWKIYFFSSSSANKLRCCVTMNRPARHCGTGNRLITSLLSLNCNWVDERNVRDGERRNNEMHTYLGVVDHCQCAAPHRTVFSSHFHKISLQELFTHDQTSNHYNSFTIFSGTPRMLIDPTCTLGSVPNVFVATKTIFNDFTIAKKFKPKTTYKLAFSIHYLNQDDQNNLQKKKLLIFVIYFELKRVIIIFVFFSSLFSCFLKNYHSMQLRLLKSN